MPRRPMLRCPRADTFSSGCWTLPTIRLEDHAIQSYGRRPSTKKPRCGKRRYASPARSWMAGSSSRTCGTQAKYVCFFCGHIGWTRHTKGDAGKEQAFKANPSWRRTCSLALTTSAAGKIAKPVFVLREADGGKPGGSRLEEIKKFPFGDSTLGASAVIVTNPTVFLLGPFTRRLSSRT